MKPEYSDDDIFCVVNDLRPGPDFEWYGCDKAGSLAAFRSAGFGFVPAQVLHNIRLYRMVVDAIYYLPSVSIPHWEMPRSPKPDVMKELAGRGLYAYDWDYRLGSQNDALPYKIMCRPNKPLNIHALAPDVAEYLRSISFEIVFSESPEVDARQVGGQ